MSMASPGPGPTGNLIRKWRRRLRYLTMGSFFLGGGIEYSVIFPTMYDYVDSLGGAEWLYGLSLAAFSISNLLLGPLYGLVFDRTHKTKLIVLFANLFEIGGNFMYCVATSKWMLLGSRFIVGVGAGAGAAIFGELARTSTKKERTKVFSIFMAVRQLGLVIGPAFNLFLRKLHFHMGPFQITRLTSPGLFMVAVWIIVEAMFLVFFYELPPISHEEEESSDSKTRKSPSEELGSESLDGTICVEPEDEVLANQPHLATINPTGVLQTTVSTDYHSKSLDESAPLLSSEAKSPTYGGATVVATDEAKGALEGRHTPEPVLLGSKLKRRLLYLLSEFIREEIIVLLATLFITIFNQTSIEAMLVPMAQKLFDWGELETSLFYSGAGLEIIMAFIFVTLVSRKVADRWQMIVGLSLEVFMYCWFVGFIGDASAGTPGILWLFLFGAVIGIFGLPLFLVTGASLYSKLIPMHIQGFGQGVRRSFFSIAAILGPLWTGGALAFDNYYTLLGVPLGLLLITVLLTLLSFSKLKEPRKQRL